MKIKGSNLVIKTRHLNPFKHPFGCSWWSCTKPCLIRSLRKRRVSCSFNLQSGTNNSFDNFDTNQPNLYWCTRQFAWRTAYCCFNCYNFLYVKQTSGCCTFYPFQAVNGSISLKCVTLRNVCIPSKRRRSPKRVQTTYMNYKTYLVDKGPE